MTHLIIVGLLLLFALKLVGFRPPGTRAFKLKNALCAAALTLVYSSSMLEFWMAFKFPDTFAEPAHIFNRLFPSAVYCIKFATACVGTLAVFVGFSLAHRKLRGVRSLYALIPLLIASGTIRVLLGFYRRRSEVTIAEFAFAAAFGFCIYAVLFLGMRRFYKNNEKLFFEVHVVK